jgi:hypothetical protein
MTTTIIYSWINPEQASLVLRRDGREEWSPFLDTVKRVSVLIFFPSLSGLLARFKRVNMIVISFYN